MQLAGFMLVMLLFLPASGRWSVSAQAPSTAPQSSRTGNWAARDAAGRMFSGSWTAKMDAATGTVTGTWTLIGPGRAVVARGAWSAAKAVLGWNGEWRAIVDGRRGELAGTWTSDAELAADAPFARLFEVSMREMGVSGSWRAGRQSGAWTIRAFE